MPLKDLTSAEQGIISECLRAAVEGPFFPMWEFQTLFGLEHHEVAGIAFAGVPLDDSCADVALAINNALNNLTGYPHGCDNVWDTYISVPPAEVRRIFDKWRGSSGLGLH